MMQGFGIIAQWIHLLSAVTAIGGTIILRAVVHPAALKLDPESRPVFERNVRARLTKFVHGSVALLILTGLMNLHRVTLEGVKWTSIYGVVFVVKVLVAMALFWLAIALTISSEGMERFQARRPYFMTVIILLGMLILLLSAWLRLLPREEPPKELVPTTATTAPHVSGPRTIPNGFKVAFSAARASSCRDL